MRPAARADDGAADQPWHRDVTAPEATRVGRRLNSLAFNLPAVGTNST